MANTTMELYRFLTAVGPFGGQIPPVTGLDGHLDPFSVSRFLLETGQDCPWLPGNGCAMFATERNDFTSGLAVAAFTAIGIPSFIVYSILFVAATVALVCCGFVLAYLSLVLIWQTLRLPFRILNKHLLKLERRRKRNERFKRMTSDEFFQYLQKLEARRQP